MPNFAFPLVHEGTREITEPWEGIRIIDAYEHRIEYEDDPIGTITELHDPDDLSGPFWKIHYTAPQTGVLYNYNTHTWEQAFESVADTYWRVASHLAAWTPENLREENSRPRTVTTVRHREKGHPVVEIREAGAYGPVPTRRRLSNRRAEQGPGDTEERHS